MYKISSVIFSFFLCLISCGSSSEGFNSIKIINNSDNDLMVEFNTVSLFEHHIYSSHPDVNTRREYEGILRDGCISAHSFKNFDRWRTYMYESFKFDTLYIGVFNKLDFDTLSLEEFKSKYPIKYEFKVTLQDMIDRDWTLVYPPNINMI